MGCIDSVLKVREDVGAVIQPCSIVTRTWTGRTVGDGIAEDEIDDIRPSPGIVDLSHDVRLMEGGSIKQGDLILTHISKNRYNREDIDGTTDGKNIERFIKVGDYHYNIIHVKEDHLTWNIHVRRHLAQGDPN